MKGIYTLVIKLIEDKTIQIGALGDLDFKKGYYVYVGSAQSGLEARIDRHLREAKKNHWHIDYFLDNAEIIDVYVSNGDKEEECRIAEYLSSKLYEIDDFGCSDCSCSSHLFFTKNIDDVYDTLDSYKDLEKYNLD